MPEILPMATLPPLDCDENIIVMDMASTLLQYGIEYEIQSNGESIDQSAVKSAFGFPNSIVIGQFDAIQAADSDVGSERAKGMVALKALASMRAWIGVMANALTSNTDNFGEVAKVVVISLADHVMQTREDRRRQAQPAATRSLFNEAPEKPLHLDSTEELQALILTLENRLEKNAANVADFNQIGAAKQRVRDRFEDAAQHVLHNSERRQFVVGSIQAC